MTKSIFNNIFLYPSLNDMDEIDLLNITELALQNRIDFKYVMHEDMIENILDEVKNDYKIVTVNDLKLSPYCSEYFDYHNYKTFHDGRLKKPNRNKVRLRHYLNGGVSFIELKQKIKGRRTLKERKQINLEQKDKEINEFLKLRNINSTLMAPTISISFNRLTLISKSYEERATIDFNLSFKDESNASDLNRLVIIEIKTPKYNHHSKLIKALQKYGIKQTSISKYCIGMALLKPNLNLVGLHKKINKLQTLNNNFHAS